MTRGGEKRTRPCAVRLQKIMAAAGLGSRRALDERIAAGEVRVNGERAEPGCTVRAGDRVEMDERRWHAAPREVRHRTLIYNKPEGEVTTRKDPQGRPTVFDRLPRLRHQRWVAVGRLDLNTTGLLLLTTDGELAHAMMHPSSGVDREYACRVRGQVGPEQLDALKAGVELEDGPARFTDIVDSGGSGENHWYHVTIMEGRNREVRRLWDSQGVTVSRLKRVRYGAAFLPHRLRMGEFHEVSARDHQVLREDIGLGEAESELVLVEEGVGARRPAPRKKKAGPRKGHGGKGAGPRAKQPRGGRQGSGGGRGASGRKPGPADRRKSGTRKGGSGSK